jgi:hypothetical protein
MGVSYLQEAGLYPKAVRTQKAPFAPNHSRIMLPAVAQPGKLPEDNRDNFLSIALLLRLG